MKDCCPYKHTHTHTYIYYIVVSVTLGFMLDAFIRQIIINHYNLYIWHDGLRVWLIVQEIGVQFQIKSYQRLKKCYLELPSLIFNIIRYVLRVKWSNPGERRSALFNTSVQQLLKRERSGRPRLQSLTPFFMYVYTYISLLH